MEVILKMMEYTCVNIKDLGKGNAQYKLVSLDRKHNLVIEKDKVKYLIKNNEIRVNNLILTSDNRLMRKNRGVKNCAGVPKANKKLLVKVAMSMEIEAGTWTEITRTLEHHIDYIIDFDSNPEIKSVSDVVSKPLNGDKDTLVSKIAVTMNFVIDTGFYEKFRGYIGHHIDYIFSLDEYPEIKSVYGCKILAHKVV